jgi:regulatory protein YycI of two-component signal transduction system YycFG
MKTKLIIIIGIALALFVLWKFFKKKKSSQTESLDPALLSVDLDQQTKDYLMDLQKQATKAQEDLAASSSTFRPIRAGATLFKPI